MSHILKFTNTYREVYYFSNHGAQWPEKPERRLIMTTADRAQAHVFESEEKAREALAISDVTVGASGWEVVPV